MNNTTEEIPNVPYAIVFDFENQFNYIEKQEWMANNWKVCFSYIGAYIVFIFLGQHFMRDRQRFELRGLLFGWNLALATFSIIGTLRVLPELLYVVREFGFLHSVCNPSYVEQTKVSGFWAWVFALSKIPELGDTVFIVLRKQPLIFLHWYHHVTVLLYAWYCASWHPASGRWFMVMNYSVHSFMYSYYALKVLRFRIPRQASMLITIGQLMQMVVGCYINVWAYLYKAQGEPCSVSDGNIRVSLLMYFSYFLLFMRFFVKAYMRTARGDLAVKAVANGALKSRTPKKID